MPPAPHLLIVGMGPRVGHHAARRFGSAGYRVGMIARSVVHLAAHQRDLAAVGVEAHYANADVADADGLRDAVEKMTVALGTPQVVLFTPADRVAGRAITVDPAAARWTWGRWAR